MIRPLHLIVLIAAMHNQGCALLSKSEPLDVRYFEAVEPARDVTPVRSAGGQEQPLRLRLGAVRASHHLDERIISRTSQSELAYHESLRWTERPAEFVRRALSKDLYEEAGFTRVLSGPAATLEVELTAFEELKDEGKARVEMNVVLHDDRVQLLQRTVRIDAPVKQGQGLGEALSVALGKALAEAAQQVTTFTTETLQQVMAKREAAQTDAGLAERAPLPQPVSP